MTKGKARKGRASSLGAICLFAAALGVAGCFGRPAPQTNNGGLMDDSSETPGAELPDGSSIEVPPIRPIPTPEAPEAAQVGDFDDNGFIDQEDVDTFVAKFGSREGQDGFLAEVDFDEDGKVTLLDFQIFLNLLEESTE